ncbi:MAG: hypothetical protein EOO12_13225 [Chitinophagaceae bacterium]|nr:MAG: hypothetical protein EOO12_13225 [Chitinophagaceae bacterium]
MADPRATAFAGSLLLKRLRADSLLREEANPDDGRSSFVVLTPKGHALLLAALKALAGPTDPLAVLDAAERTQLSALLDKIDAAQSPLHQLRPLKDLLGPRG